MTTVRESVYSNSMYGIPQQYHQKVSQVVGRSAVKGGALVAITFGLMYAALSGAVVPVAILGLAGIVDSLLLGKDL